MRASLKRVIGKFWLATFIVVALVFVVSYFHDHREAIAQLLNANLKFLAIAASAHVAYFVVTVTAWRSVLRQTTREQIGFREGLAQILLVNFGKYIPGKVWGIAARGKRLSELGLNIESIGRASYLEQALLMLTGFWLAFLCAAISLNRPIYWFALAGATLAIALIRHGDGLAARISVVLPRLSALMSAFDVRIRTYQIFFLSLCYVIAWLFLSAAFMFMAVAVTGVELALDNFPVFVLAISAGFLAGFLALFAPGGVGVREGVGAVFLASIITLENAFLLLLLFRVWVIAAELLAGALVLGAAQRGKGAE